MIFNLFNECPFCNKIVWFFNKRIFFEITPDWGLFAHRECYTKENALNYHKKWFQDIEKGGQNRRVKSS